MKFIDYERFLRHFAEMLCGCGARQIEFGLATNFRANAPSW